MLFANIFGLPWWYHQRDYEKIHQLYQVKVHQLLSQRSRIHVFCGRRKSLMKLRLSVFFTISKFKTVLTDFLGLWISAEIFLTRGSGFEYFIIPFLALGREQRIESRLFYNTAGCFILLSCDGLSLSSWRLNRILIDLFCIILQGNMHAGCEWDNFATQWYINAFFLVSPLVVTWLRD